LKGHAHEIPYAIALPHSKGPAITLHLAGYRQRLFAGANRQTGLVKPVATHASPLRKSADPSITVAVLQRSATICLAKPPFGPPSTRRLTRAPGAFAHHYVGT
jgi:hypothetical protein